jgi:nitrite reductase (NO-forming)
MKSDDPRRGRVARSHTVTATAFRLSGVFIAWAGVWALMRLVDGTGGWWGPLHLFMAGAVMLAISGATQLFSVTWAAAVPADRRLAGAQRWVVAVGAAAAVIGVTRGIDGLTIAGAVLVGAGLIGLGWILVGIVRRSLLRRFALPGRFYLLAVASGVAGVTLGGIVGVGGAGGAYLDARTAHMHLNLIGLVGFTIVGTLPTILPTTVRHRMVSGREATVAYWVCVVAAVLMAAGLIWGPVPVGAGAGLAALGGALILGGIVVRLGVRRVGGAGLPALLIATGTVWLLGWAAHQAVVLLGGAHTVYGRPVAIGVAGVAMVLFGSLAYLIPVLAGGGEALTANFARLHGWGLPRVLVANAVPILVLAGAPAAAAGTAAGVFVADFAVRVGRVLAARATPAGSSRDASGPA